MGIFNCSDNMPDNHSNEGQNKVNSSVLRRGKNEKHRRPHPKG